MRIFPIFLIFGFFPKSTFERKLTSVFFEFFDFCEFSHFLKFRLWEHLQWHDTCHSCSVVFWLVLGFNPLCIKIAGSEAFNFVKIGETEVNGVSLKVNLHTSYRTHSWRRTQWIPLEPLSGGWGNPSRPAGPWRPPNPLCPAGSRSAMSLRPLTRHAPQGLVVALRHVRRSILSTFCCLSRDPFGFLSLQILFRRFVFLFAPDFFWKLEIWKSFFVSTLAFWEIWENANIWENHFAKICVALFDSLDFRSKLWFLKVSGFSWFFEKTQRYRLVLPGTSVTGVSWTILW